MRVSWCLLLFFLAPCLSRPREAPATFTGTQVLRISNDPKGVVQKLIQKKGLDVWAGNETLLDVRVPSDLVESIKKSLKSKKIPYETLIRDLQEVIDKENPKDEIRLKAGKRSMSWDQYQTLDTIYEFMDTLARENPKFVSVGVMGQSVENRPIKYVKISSGRPNAKAIFIEGGIHAREWVSPASVTYIMRELVQTRKRHRRNIQDIDFYIAPVVNPDGYVYTYTRDRMWRKNRSMGNGCAGVDLNRNFDFHWGGKGTSGNSCDETYRGKSPASEPEVKAIQNFLKTIGSNLKGYISFHAYGQLIMTPYGYDYYSYAENYAEMKRVGDEAANAIVRQGGPRYTVGNIAHAIYPAAGSSADWAKAIMRTPIAFAVELRGSFDGREGFLLPAQYIIPTAKDAMEIVKATAASIARL